jgi:hypothetical protein
MKDLNNLEASVLDKLLAGEDANLRILRKQLALAEVVEHGLNINDF